MPYTLDDFDRDFVEEHLARLPPEQLAKVLQGLPPERLLGGLSETQIREYLDHISAKPAASPHKAKRKK